jgi:hypothetical protein
MLSNNANDRPSTAKKVKKIFRASVATVLAGSVAYYVPPFLALYVEQREILLAFTALFGVLLIGVRKLGETLALRDKVITEFEFFHLDGLTLFKIIAFFACVQYAAQILLDYFNASTVLVPNLILMLGVLLVMALSLIPALSSNILGGSPSSTVVGDEPEEEEEEEGNDDNENSISESEGVRLQPIRSRRPAASLV